MDHPGPYAIGAQEWPGLSKLVEETGELQQVLGKLLGISGSLEHWDGDLTPRLIAEIGDVEAAIEFFVAKNFSVEQRVEVARRRHHKVQIFHDWHDEGDPR